MIFKVFYGARLRKHTKFVRLFKNSFTRVIAAAVHYSFIILLGGKLFVCVCLVIRYLILFVN